MNEPLPVSGHERLSSRTRSADARRGAGHHPAGESRATKSGTASKALFKNALLLTVSLAVALGLTEIMLRAIAELLPDVKYLATAGREPPRSYGSLDDLLKAWREHLVPHRDWYNYYANSLGFIDREFSEAKPEGTLRIMALGDSFVYGLVPYPQNVITLVGAHLRTGCRGGDVDVMNFGVPATGVREYRLVHKLAAPKYRPDMVVVHFYMGNDGPGLVLERQESRGILDRSYARTFLVSSLKVLTSWNRPRVAASAGTAAPPMGGERVSEQPDITDSEFEPAFSEQTFGAIAADELGRLYRDNNWSETLAELDALRTEVVARTGHKPIIMLYPSALQVYPERFETTRRAVAKRLQTLGLKPDDFSQTSPNRILLDYCWRSGLSCFDLTPAMTKAGSESADPLYRPRETHWNIRGNRVAAAAEGEFLRQKICEAAGL